MYTPRSDPYRLVEKARACLDSGDDFKAREAILRGRSIASDDPLLHFKWARLCEEMGMARQAKDSYRKALRIAPEDSEILYSFALLLSETGYYEESIHCLKKAIKNNQKHAKAKELLSEAYLALGLTGLADTLHPREKKKTESIRYFPPSVGEENTKKFLELFAGREVGYAFQVVNRERGDISYEFRDAPLCHDLVEKHINGDITLAAYPLRTDKTVKYATVEIRLRKRVLMANLKNQGYLAYLGEKALHHSLSLKKVADRFGIPAYVDSNGAHGYRLWFFFREFGHFLRVKDFLKRFLEQTPPPESSIHVEPVLATKGIGIGWVEQAILLPLGVNKATHRRCLFLDEEGEPFSEQLKFLAKIRETHLSEARKAFRKAHQPPPSENGLPGMDEAALRLIKACTVLSEVSAKARRGRTLAREEKVILFYTVGLLEPDGTSLHSLLETCPDYSYDKVERQRLRLRPNPISCPKIREWVPGISAAVLCNCAFDLRGGKYPSPVLHVNPHLVGVSKELDLPDHMPVKEAARRYINLKRQASELERAMEKLTAVLENHFTGKGVARIKVGNCVLRRREKDGVASWEIGN